MDSRVPNMPVSSNAPAPGGVVKKELNDLVEDFNSNPTATLPFNPGVDSDWDNDGD